MWIPIVLQVIAGQADGLQRIAVHPISPDQRNLAVQAATDNFVVTSYASGPDAKPLATRCELWREELQRKWLGQLKAENWNPKCEVVLHTSRDSYAGAVGPGAGRTSGSSLIRFDRGDVAMRRIDLLVDSRGNLPALRHELTHVVLSDRFGGREPPRWADEGIATLADSPRKRALHRRDCWRSLQDNTAFRLVELLRVNRLYSVEQQAAFYGQSLTLVSFLVQKKTSAEFVRFVELAMDEGYDYALAECYKIQDLNKLEKLWREHAISQLASGAKY